MQHPSRDPSRLCRIIFVSLAPEHAECPELLPCLCRSPLLPRQPPHLRPHFHPPWSLELHSASAASTRLPERVVRPSSTPSASTVASARRSELRVVRPSSTSSAPAAASACRPELRVVHPSSTPPASTVASARRPKLRVVHPSCNPVAAASVHLSSTPPPRRLPELHFAYTTHRLHVRPSFFFSPPSRITR
ncbi:hypothetical protein PR202_ga02350 [Eleusine coracana subsp. coracana]|uniref:Uncharacterized protein n=1 Tax=Eleusine coracana subsp. coracana TaxID=191504 RepID=A0AAV5BKJ7_ELECO|nr:hypothetical protein PR202_ga02350 [Eleusine coracana subsp. coracana]